MKKYLIGFIGLLVFVFLLYYFWPDAGSNIKSVKIAGQDVKVELALTDAEREQGLSDRPSLADGTGMLFVFSKPDKYKIWMKDMNFPIDIVWITDKMNVVAIKRNADPKLYPETYSSSENAKYVLELPAGFSDKNNLHVGDSAVFTY